MIIGYCWATTAQCIALTSATVDSICCRPPKTVQSVCGTTTIRDERWRATEATPTQSGTWLLGKTVCVCVCACVCVCMCVCVCVCVCERERERESECEVCVCGWVCERVSVCVGVRERESECVCVCYLVQKK